MNENHNSTRIYKPYEPSRLNIINKNLSINDYYHTDTFIIQPMFQRHYVWDNNKAAKLIESILMNFPIPPIYAYIKDENSIVIDGQQRLTSIKNFIDNRFPLKNLLHFGVFNGLFFKDLPEKYKQVILDYILNIVLITGVEEENIIFDIFERFNTGGVHLNSQEIRNCIFNGKYNSLISDLANYEPFNMLFDKNKIDRMEKEEYVLRFLALYDDFDKYNGNMIKFLDNYIMRKNSLKDKNFIEMDFKRLKKAFENSFYCCQAIFGEDMFKNCVIYKTNNTNINIMYKLMSKPVFDLQMLSVTDMDFALINRFARQLKRKYEEVIINDDKIRPYYKKMSKKALSYRIEKWREYISEIINQ